MSTGLGLTAGGGEAGAAVSTQCSFLSVRELRVELRQVLPGRRDICLASGDSSSNTRCFWEGLLQAEFPGRGVEHAHC